MAISRLRSAALLLALLSAGLLAGFFYAFSSSVSLGLRELDDAGYEDAWNLWNALRVVACTAALGCLGWAMRFPPSRRTGGSSPAPSLELVGPRHPSGFERHAGG